MDVDLSVNLCEVRMENPTMLASGILGGTSGSLRRVAKNGAGALITKSIGPKPRKGYPGPTVNQPMDNVLLNAMGLPNPGYEEFINEIEALHDLDVPLIPSIFGEKAEEFAVVAKAFEEAGAKLIEVNVSCPHPDARNGKKELFAQSEGETVKVVKAIKKKVKIPIMVKLSPNVTHIGDIALAVVKAGADAISAINTISAIEIEPTLERPVLGNLVGGQSGGAIQPIALRKVADIILALKKAGKDVPVVGVGGIRTGEDIAKYLLLGVRCIQIGTAVQDDIFIFKKCVEELKMHMKQKGYHNLNDIRGNSLKWLH